MHGDAGRTFVNAGWTVTREIVTTGNTTSYTERFTNASYELAAGGAADALYGGAGSDWLYGETGDDLLDAGSGDDVAFGGDDNDTILVAVVQTHSTAMPEITLSMAVMMPTRYWVAPEPTHTMAVRAIMRFIGGGLEALSSRLPEPFNGVSPAPTGEKISYLLRD